MTANAESGSAGREGVRRATEIPAETKLNAKRFSARKKSKIVMRLLRGEAIEILSREYGVTVAKLSKWRDDFLAGGEEAIKERTSDPRDNEISRLHEKLGESTMEIELLYEKIRRLESNSPLPRRRSRR
jgi:predicted RNase H-like nuclease (RuvC/YqgF family)